MVDSRKKGQRGEYLVRDLLRKYTDLSFERVPASGALAYLKGDLYIPNEDNRFCIEVKNYEESPFTDKIFTNKSNYINIWWAKVVEQASQRNQVPLLFFKYNRSKIFVCTNIKPNNVEKYMYISWLDCYCILAEDWLDSEKQEWLNLS
jgi:Holliday junction resolvase